MGQPRKRAAKISLFRCTSNPKFSFAFHYEEAQKKALNAVQVEFKRAKAISLSLLLADY